MARPIDRLIEKLFGKLGLNEQQALMPGDPAQAALDEQAAYEAMPLAHPMTGATMGMPSEVDMPLANPRTGQDVPFEMQLADPDLEELPLEPIPEDDQARKRRLARQLFMSLGAGRTSDPFSPDY